MASRKSNQSHKVNLDALEDDKKASPKETPSASTTSSTGSRSDSSSNKKKASGSKRDKEKVYDVDTDKAEREYTKEMIMSREVKDDDDDDKKITIKDRFKSLTLSDFLWVTLAPMLIFGLIIGIIASALSGGEEVVEKEPEDVKSVEGAYSILDDVESLKDDQIMSLRKQIASLKSTGNGAISEEEANALVSMSNDAANALDPFFSATLGISRNAKKSEMTTHQQNLSDYFTDEASTSTIYDFLNGPTPAKQLNEDVAKSGRILPTWAGSSEKGVVTYVVYAPIVSESGTASAVYTVTLERDHKISDINYNGIVIDGKTPMTSSLAKQLRGDEKKSGDFMRGNNEKNTDESKDPGGESPSQDSNSGELNKGDSNSSEGESDSDSHEVDGVRRGDANDINDGNAKTISEYDARKDDVFPAPGAQRDDD